MHLHERQSGFTLIELLIVVSILALAIGMMIPYASSSVRDQLENVAEILAGDIAYARSLAVSNADNYRITFDLTNNQYALQYVGSNSALSALPKSPFSLPADPVDQQIIRLANMPQIGIAAQLYGVQSLSTSPQSVTTLEFGPLGETTRSEETRIWLSAGAGTNVRYLSVRVNPVTGLTWIENFQAKDPLSTGTTSGTSSPPASGS